MTDNNMELESKDAMAGGDGGRDNPALQLDEEDELEKGNRGGSDQSEFADKKDRRLSDRDDEEEAGVVTFEDLEFSPNWVSKVEDAVGNAWMQVKDSMDAVGGAGVVVKLTLFVLYNVFFFYAVYRHLTGEDGEEVDWCQGLGFLIIITVAMYVGYIYFKIVKPAVKKFLKSPKGAAFTTGTVTPLRHKYNSALSHRLAAPLIYLTVFAAVTIFLIADSYDEPQRLRSYFGLLVLVVLGWVFSAHPSRVVWRHVAWGLTLQFVFGLIILRWTVGQAVFQCLGDKVSAFLRFTDAGSGFVFGYLADVSLGAFATYKLEENTTAYEVATAINEAGAVNWVFMFYILSVIYFFSFFISMLFHLGWMQWVVIQIGWLLQVTVGTTACESLNAAANIFLGQSEAPLMIKPYLPKMTPSELHAVMTGGFATIAGTVLAAYISFGVSASHLLSASVMSAPAALAMAKLMMPETKKTKTMPKDIKIDKGNAANILDAASEGAVTAVFLVANIGATLVAVLAFVAFLNGIVGWLGDLVDAQELLDIDERLSIEYILGKLFIPLAWLMGVPTEDLEAVGTLIGLKTFVNEFAAYDRLGRYDQKGEISERAKTIATYALCGFSNPASVGIQIAALSTMAPNRRSDLARVAARAFVAGSMACFLTACIAGSLISSDSE